MPKLINYPKNSYSRSFELTQALDSLGGNSSIAIVAEKLGKSVGGSFSNLVGAAVKFGLVTNKGGQLEITDLYRNIKYAYDENERYKFQQKSFLKPKVFRQLCEKFNGLEIPKKMLDKILIREYNVSENVAGRVAKYFSKGIEEVGLLRDGKIHVIIDSEPEANHSKEENPLDPKPDISNAFNSQDTPTDIFIPTEQEEYSIQISGPNINSRIVIRDEDDLMIVEITLKKIKKLIEKKREET